MKQGASVQASGRVLTNPHLWILVAIVASGTLVYYAEYLPYLGTIQQKIAPSVPFVFAHYSPHRMLCILPVAYTAFVFGLRGGSLASGLIVLLLLPRTLLTPADRGEALLEVAAFSSIGLMVSWLIDRERREKVRHARTIEELESARQGLLGSMEVVTKSEQRLASLNRVSGIVSQSLELNQILDGAIDNVIDTLHVEAVLVFLLDPNANELALAAYRGVSAEFAQGVGRIKVGEGFNGWVAQTGQPLLVKDAAEDPRLTRIVVREESIRSQLIVPLKSKGKVVGTLCVAARSLLRVVPEEVELLAAIGNQIGVAIENARLYRQERTISEQLRCSEERYRGLFDNASESILVLDLEGGIVAANKACEKLTGYPLAEMVGNNIGSFLTRQSLAIVKRTIQGLLNGQTWEGSSELRLRRRDGTEGIAELMAGLVIQDNRPVGVQAIIRDVTEQRQMQENMRFYLSQVVQAQEEERKRVARELHDDTAQTLAGLSRGLEVLTSEDSELSQEFLKHLKELHERTDEALEGVRRFSQDLRPSILDDLGLLAALEWLVENMRKQGQVDARVEVLGEPVRLSPEAELTLFRIAQEALSNVRRHSRASAVQLTIDLRDSKVTMAIADNGQGFEAPRKLEALATLGKLGIMGMQERARLLGGSVTVCSEPGRGTTVVVEVPKG